VFSYPVAADDLESVDPELYTGRVAYIRDSVYLSRDGMELSDLELTFEAEFNFEEYTSMPGGGGVGVGGSGGGGVAATAAVELKPGGKAIAVTEANKAEYLQLFVAHRLVGEVQLQVDAFRAGLAVFFTDEVLAAVHTCCGPADIQLLLCGVSEIDVDDWEQSAEYSGGLTADTPLAQWFWHVVREMDADSQAKLLHFCTGSSRGSVTPPCPLSRTRYFPVCWCTLRVALCRPSKEAASPLSRVVLLLSCSRHLAMAVTPILTRAVRSSIMLLHHGGSWEPCCHAWCDPTSSRFEASLWQRWLPCPCASASEPTKRRWQFGKADPFTQMRARVECGGLATLQPGRRVQPAPRVQRGAVAVPARVDRRGWRGPVSDGADVF
jgi:hypothetical protein